MPKTISDNYLKIIKKIKNNNKERYSLIKKTLERKDVQAIKRNADIRISKAVRVANILGVTIDELIYGKKTLENAGDSVRKQAVLESQAGYIEENRKESKDNLTREGKDMEIEEVKRRLKNRIEETTDQERLKKLQRIVDDWESEDIKRRKEAEEIKSKKNTTA